MLRVLTLLVVLIFGCSSVKKISEPIGEPQVELAWNCESAQEFVTAHEFLKEGKAVKVEPRQAQQYALQVSEGCTGAAKRFISVVRILRKAGASPRKSVEVGIAASKRTDEGAEAFLTVFKRAFPRSGLDLNLDESLNLAKAIAIDYQGDAETAEEDFEDMVDFCLAKNGLNLSKAKCATLARNVTLAGEYFDGSAAEMFIEGYEYLSGDDGPNLTTAESLEITEELVTTSPKAVKNFKTAFEYASSESGMKLGRKDAIDAARKVAIYTKVKVPKSR